MNAKHRNRLADSNSPYLLQHADNPVEWYPWGEEAFARAAKEDKPLFISIGYSTCHWCHVMARESFEDEDVARELNRVFVSIKVDREERPDIDAFYMDAALLLNGSGGWPLTVLATPQGRPFFVATYIPPREQGRHAGMLEMIPKIERLWRDERRRVLDAAEQITGIALGSSEKASENAPKNSPDYGAKAEELCREAERQLSASFDDEHGGFGGSPKFPQPQLLHFLLLRSTTSPKTGAERQQGHRGASSSPEAEAAPGRSSEFLSMTEKSLRAMRAGGVFDHVGFGFHRYAVDRGWKIPHFEKMLYDQALLARLYLEAYEATGSQEYAVTAREIFTFVERDLSAPEGGYYSALDAESEGEEGRFYLWDYEEFRSLLEGEHAEWVDFFHVHPEGNWNDPASGRKQNSNILYTRPEQPPPEPLKSWETVRRRLLAAREKRPRPSRDDKILTDWNGLLLAALARGARVLEDAQLANRARSTAEFLLSRLRDPAGGLLHSYRAGHAAVPGTLDDYAFLIDGLIELYEEGFEIRYLEKAVELAATALKHFEASGGGDKDGGGGFFFTAPSGGTDEGKRPQEPQEPQRPNTTVAVRSRRIFDGAMPSGYGVMTGVLLRLFRLTGEPEYRSSALAAFRVAEGQVSRAPHGAASLLSALQLLPDYGGWEIVIAGDGPATEEMLAAIRRRYLPRTLVLRKRQAEAEQLSQIAPFTDSMTAEQNGAAAYLCRNFQCRRPVTTAAELEKMLDED